MQHTTHEHAESCLPSKAQGDTCTVTSQTGVVAFMLHRQCFALRIYMRHLKVAESSLLQSMNIRKLRHVLYLYLYCNIPIRRYYTYGIPSSQILLSVMHFESFLTLGFWQGQVHDLEVQLQLPGLLCEGLVKMVMWRPLAKLLGPLDALLKVPSLLGMEFLD